LPALNQLQVRAITSRCDIVERAASGWRMKRIALSWFAILFVLFAGRASFADEPEGTPADDHAEQAAPPDQHHEAAPADEHHEAAAADEHHEAAAADEHHEAAAAEATDDADEDDAHYSKFDPDGDGHDDPALEKEYEAAMGGIKPEIDTDAVDKELEARPQDKDLLPSISADQFRAVVRVVKKVVLARMEKKVEKSSAKKMAQFSMGISGFSLLGVLLLFLPFVYAKKYPGKAGTLFKYSGLAALVFFVTVNLFGSVLYGLKTAQGTLGNFTNPSLAIARGTFDTLDTHAEEYLTMGKELFAPTLEQLQGNSDEQPSVLLLENGTKIVKSAGVFITVAKMFKKLDFVFKVLPIILFGVTMILFGLAIRPTLTEIVKLPMRAASGEAGAGRQVTGNAMRRVWGELKAGICTIGVLTLLTLVSGFVLGETVGPALHELLHKFSLAVNYLQFVPNASTGLVFAALFGVMLFLALNIATLILSMSFFLGKSQKIFQRRFNEGEPISKHARYFRLGVPAVLFVQLLPWLFVVVADKVLNKIDASILDGVTDASKISWGKLMLAGPLFLVVGYVLMFWAARGIKAIRFLKSYDPRGAAAPLLRSEPLTTRRAA
jgi:hypothetical protein